jgi:hypothetical protein
VFNLDLATIIKYTDEDRQQEMGNGEWTIGNRQ